MLKDFYKGKRVLVTGHTGFKGAWLSYILLQMGAEVTGYSLNPPVGANLYEVIKLQSVMKSVYGDIRDLKRLQDTFETSRPEIVFHLAAQPIVRESYNNPVYTYDVNVMGTVNVLECIRMFECVKSFVNVTTDKVYNNREWEWGYRECDELNGYDPYSNSKSCSELVTESFRRSFFNDRELAISTARAGNVVGGGDFAKDRIIPDCVRAIEEGNTLCLRNPYSVRPYQHVLEALGAYLLIAQKQYEDMSLQGSYNIGPKDDSCISTGSLVDTFSDLWEDVSGEKLIIEYSNEKGPHEADYLKLDCSRIKRVIGWEAKWNYYEMLERTVEWVYSYLHSQDIMKVMDSQINDYFISVKNL